MIRRSFFALGIAVLVAGCITVQDTNLVTAGHGAADRLVAKLGNQLPRNGNLLYTSFAPINDLSSSSPFGQMLAEQTASRLSQNGLNVTEARLRGTLAISPQGEFMLSRNLPNLLHSVAREQNASAVLVGTYAVGDTVVLLSLRIVDVTSGTIMASDDFSVPLGRNTQQLLGIPLRRH